MTLSTLGKTLITLKAQSIKYNDVVLFTSRTYVNF